MESFQTSPSGLLPSSVADQNLEPRARKQILLVTSIRSRFERHLSPWRGPQERRALHLKRFQVRTQCMFIPAENCADAQCRFAAARLRPAAAKRYGHATQQHIR